MEENLILHISTIDANLADPSVFYVHPKRLNLVHILKKSLFESCLIDYTPIDYLTSINFAYIMKTLKSEAPCKVIIHQPISVMQDYDAKQVEANAKLAGFTDFENSTSTFKDEKSGKEFNTISVNCIRPVKTSKLIEVKVTKTTIKSNKESPEKKTNENSKATTASTKGGKTDIKVEIAVNKNKSKK